LNTCTACNQPSDAHIHQVAEMMAGLRQKFEYAECLHCGTLQLLNTPADMATFYQVDYYSTSKNVAALFQPAWKAKLKSIRDYYCFTGKNAFGKLIQQWMPNKAIAHFNFQRIGLKKKMKMLDVGCGNGVLTYALYNAGFKNIKGVEPFIAADIQYHNGLRIYKGFIDDVKGNDFDFIMFNHSFEHLPNPDEVLDKVYAKLSANGICLMRIPTVSSFAWRKYRQHWVQLDAPRHCYLYSKEGLSTMAQRHQFSVRSIVSESTSFQFLGSEQYLKDIPLHGDKRSWFEGNQELFSPADVAAFEQEASKLNVANDGDSIAVVLVKK
jgi:ubiquinone/menaquinone biosynthesis C-methylase UbiE